MDTLIPNKSKELLYVTVYDKLFKMITEGTFPKNSRLPSEPDLAKRLGVSRSTLRQSLALLQDDGLIKNIRGKGNFITNDKLKNSNGLEKFGHPVYKCLNEEPDDLEMEFKIDPPSDYYLKVLNSASVATVCVDRWYLKNKSSLAYSYTIIPIEEISKLNLNLNDKEEFKKFIEEDIYNDCTKIEIKIKISKSGNFVTKNHPIAGEDTFYLLEEAIYKSSNTPIILNKHYLPVKTSTIKINPTR